jgi:hypothetical protein
MRRNTNISDDYFSDDYISVMRRNTYIGDDYISDDYISGMRRNTYISDDYISDDYTSVMRRNTRCGDVRPEREGIEGGRARCSLESSKAKAAATSGPALVLRPARSESRPPSQAFSRGGCVRRVRGRQPLVRGVRRRREEPACCGGCPLFGRRCPPPQHARQGRRSDDEERACCGNLERRPCQ